MPSKKTSTVDPKEIVDKQRRTRAVKKPKEVVEQETTTKVTDTATAEQVKTKVEEVVDVILEEKQKTIEGNNTFAHLLEDPMKQDSTLSWSPLGNVITPFEYGYLSPVGDDHYNVELRGKDGIFKVGQKASNQNPILFLMNGSYRSFVESTIASPSDILINENLNISQAEQIWKVSLLTASSFYGSYNDQFRWLMNDTSRKWYNGIRMPNGKIRGIRKPPISFDRAKATIRSATEVAKGILNTGTDIDIFLPHSGISVVLRSPNVSEFIELEKKIIEDNLTIGRSTRGLFGNSDLTYLYRAVWELFIKCIKSTSVEVIDEEFLRRMISLQDMDIIAWVLSCAKYPNGFLISLPCFANPNKCNHVSHEVIDLRKLYVVDDSLLTDKQRALAGDLSGKNATLEDVHAYVNDFQDRDNIVELYSTDDALKIRIELVTPSVEAAFSSADKWINTIEKACDESFKQPLIGNARTRFLLEQKQATMAMMYEHFVENILIVNTETDEEVVLDDPDSIEQIILSISENEIHLNQFLTGVIKYINMNRLYVIGIPNIECPSCHGYHDAASHSQVGKRVIPLDPITVFLTLCQQQTSHYRRVAEDHMKETKPSGVN